MVKRLLFNRVDVLADRLPVSQRIQFAPFIHPHPADSSAALRYDAVMIAEIAPHLAVSQPLIKHCLFHRPKLLDSLYLHSFANPLQLLL